MDALYIELPAFTFLRLEIRPAFLIRTERITLITSLRVAYLMSYMITGWQTSISHNGCTSQRIARTSDRGCTGEATEVSRDTDV